MNTLKGMLLTGLLLGAGCLPTNTPVNTNSININTEIAVVPIEGVIQLNAPFSTRVYDLSTASTFLGNLEILEDGETKTMYTQVFSPLYQPAVSFDRTTIFLARYQQHEGLETEYLVVNPETGDAHVLAAQPCLNEQGYWQGNTLITYSNASPDEAGVLPTDICFWNKTGELLGTYTKDLFWSAAASAPYLSDAIGIVPNAPQPQAWVYTEFEPGRCGVTTYAYEDKVEVMTQEINNAAQPEGSAAKCRPAQFKFNYPGDGGVYIEPNFLDDLTDPIDAVTTAD